MVRIEWKRSMTRQFDLGKMIFSVIVLRPRETFFAWLEKLLEKRGMTVDQVYFQEENDVWLIPRLGTFEGTPSFDAYIKSIKPNLLKSALEAFGIESPDDIPGRWTPELFDEFFELDVYDSARKAPM